MTEIRFDPSNPRMASEMVAEAEAQAAAAAQVMPEPTDPDPAANPPPPETDVAEVSVTIEDAARTVPLDADQVFIYAPSADPNHPRVRAAMERAAETLRREIAAANGHPLAGPRARGVLGQPALVLVPDQADSDG